MTPDPPTNGAGWRPRWWIRATTITAYLWGLALGTWEALHQGRLEVLGFAAGLVLLGMGLSAAADRVFRR